MNIRDNVKQKIKASVLVATVSGVLMSTALADVLYVRAEFAPDPSNPGANRFVNKTPLSGYCEKYQYWCGLRNVFSIQSNITAESNAPLLVGHSRRKGPMFEIPASWKEVQVYHKDGTPAIVSFRLVSIGATYNLNQPVNNLVGRPDVAIRTAHSLLWGGTENGQVQGQWSNPRPPCRNASNVTDMTDRTYEFFWTAPVGANCGKTAAFDIPSFSYSKLDFMYELTTPEPLKMKAGTYTGSLPYRVGPMMDIDLGDVMIPSQSELIIDFTLEVDHIFKVEIPPGGNTVSLVPEGGWQAWLTQPRRATRLFRDQTFNIWTSSPFKMSIVCQYDAPNSACALQDDKNNQVLVDVSVSLPHGLRDTAGAVNRRPLRVDGVGTEKFEPSQYVDRKPGTLHFEVSKRVVEEMLNRDSLRYSGDITVIWDSEI